MTDTYDLVAIGAGPAGESATELAAFFGHRSAVIEKAQPGGIGVHCIGDIASEIVGIGQIATLTSTPRSTVYAVWRPPEGRRQSPKRAGSAGQ
jgi:flavin-dependent dehydrogenase